MSELERLLAIARRHDPVPAGTLVRVERRLGDPRSGVTWGWLVAVSAALMAIWAWPRTTPPPEGEIERGQPTFSAERLQAPAPIVPVAGLEAPRLRPVNTAPLEPPPPDPSTPRAPIEQAPFAPTASAPIPPAPTVPPKAGGSSRRILGYRPRAFRDPSAFEWQTLEGEDLPAAIQAIVDRRDPNALLAALDPLPLDGRALLLARAELRAADDRCDEAIGDFDQVLRTAPQEPRALAGRAACRP
ncbi:MAG: hypothetical protein IPG45_32445 [Deltaproteobacteria bacterium]|jgi:hypothetical protein|nr:hypothetical protein [Deltaproteobacteria bacterium]